MFSLKIGLVGPVDQQINLVLAKGHIFKKVNKQTKRLRDLGVPFHEYLNFFQERFILIFESSGKVELFFDWNSRISIYEKDYQYLTCHLVITLPITILKSLTILFWIPTQRNTLDPSFLNLFLKPSERFIKMIMIKRLDPIFVFLSIFHGSLEWLRLIFPHQMLQIWPVLLQSKYSIYCQLKPTALVIVYKTCTWST